MRRREFIAIVSGLVSLAFKLPVDIKSPDDLEAAFTQMARDVHKRPLLLQAHLPFS